MLKDWKIPTKVKVKYYIMVVKLVMLYVVNVGPLNLNISTRHANVKMDGNIQDMARLENHTQRIYYK